MAQILMEPIKDDNPLQEALGELCTLQSKLDAYISSPEWSNRRKIVQNDQDLDRTVNFIHTLLKDTNVKCTKLVDKRSLADSKIGGQLESCKDDMAGLRKELAYASRCVHDIEENLMMNGSATESDPEINHCAERELEVTVYRLREENEILHSQLSALRNELHQLRLRQMEQAALSSPKSVPPGRDYNCNDVMLMEQRLLSSNNSVVMKLQEELVQSRQSLMVVKQDRKHLKQEKCELLSQMKDVYETLEAKERELRDFIRQYEHRMKEGDQNLKELCEEKNKADEERVKLSQSMSSLQMKVRQLENGMEDKENQNNRLFTQLQELQGRFLLLTGQPAPCDLDCSPMEHRTPPKSLRTPSIGYSSGASASPATPHDANNTGFSMSNSITSPDMRRDTAMFRDSETVKVSDAEGTVVEVKLRNKGRSRREHGGSASSDRSAANRLSRLFGFASSNNHSQSRSSSSTNQRRIPTESATTSSLCNVATSSSLQDAMASDMTLATKNEKLNEARIMPLVRWKQVHLLAWLELELGLPDNQLRLFADNVKSGKVMLNLSDHDLESSLGVKSWVLKKKLRLAIEESRAPSLCKFPHLREIDWQYVVSNLLPACGLVQFQEPFKTCLVDGRMLNVLTKRQLDKYLGVTKKFHQNSVHKAVELLQRYNFDVNALAKKRQPCDNGTLTSDLLIWTNEHIGKWLKQIDLQEYLHNLQTSGIHGAVAVLEPSFTAETLANALAIPQNKQIVRKHLHAEFSQLLFEARSQLSKCMTSSRKSRDSGSLGRNFVRSYSPTHVPSSDLDSNDTPRKRGLRSSFGRVFGIRGRRMDDYSSDISPVRLLTGSKSLPEHPMSPDSRKLLMDEIATSKCGTGTQNSVGQNTAEGTMSSSTSDLGSSMERSQHMKTILSTPKVLLQAPVTGVSPRTNTLLSASADSAISSDEPTISQSTSTITAGKDLKPVDIVIKMRSKSTGRFASADTNRPHSIAEFNCSGQTNREAMANSQSSSWITASTHSSSSRLPTMGVCSRGRARPHSVLDSSTSSYTNSSSTSSIKQMQYSSNNINNNNNTSDSNESRQSPSSDDCSTVNGSVKQSHMNAITEGDDEGESESMEHKPIATSKGVWARSDKKLPVAGIQAAKERQNRNARNSPLNNPDLQETDL